MKTDREKLIELICIAPFYNPRLEFTYGDCLELIKLEYLADYLIKHGVKIPVRCKDCQYYGITGDQSCEVHSSTWLEDDYHIVTMEPDDYCSYGERKEE